jgi:murein L,D-transpeptidase YafK
VTRIKLILVGLLALAAVPSIGAVNEFVAQDRCLDGGGTWFDSPIGCVFEMPEIDLVVIDKSERRLRAYSGGELVRTMIVSLGREPVGDKQRDGDNRTPEGVYPITEHKADSGYHLALRIGYPTRAEAAEAERDGLDPGSDIMIHGIRNGLGWIGGLHRHVDWTRGCIAITNGEIEWLYQSTNERTLVEITP